MVHFHCEMHHFDIYLSVQEHLIVPSAEIFEGKINGPILHGLNVIFTVHCILKVFRSFLLLLELNGLEINSGEHKSASEPAQNSNSDEIKKEFEEISTEDANIEVCVEENFAPEEHGESENRPIRRQNEDGPMEIEWLDGMPDDPYPNLNDIGNSSPNSDQGWL